MRNCRFSFGSARHPTDEAQFDTIVSRFRRISSFGYRGNSFTVCRWDRLFSKTLTMTSSRNSESIDIGSSGLMSLSCRVTRWCNSSMSRTPRCLIKSFRFSMAPQWLSDNAQSFLLYLKQICWNCRILKWCATMTSSSVIGKPLWSSTSKFR